MRASTGSVIAIALALASRTAHAQANDFATCAVNAVEATTCNSTSTACCKRAASAGSTFLQSGTDYAVIIPLDYCHQAGTASPQDGSAPTWCSKPTSSGGMATAYGLVYRLLQNGIPVYWVVNPSKTPVALGSTNGPSAEITTDIDAWVLDSATTTPPATSTTALASCSGCTPPVKHLNLSSSGTLSIDSAWTYDKKQFPIRGSAFVIRASDRASFNKFVQRQAPYASWAAGRSCGAGASCQDFSSVDMFEIQPTARIGWTDYTVATSYPNGFRGDEMPVAARLNYSPPRIARIGPGGVAQAWLGQANLEDVAATGCASTTTFSPSDAVVCNVTESDISANYLVTKNFGWLWLDHWQASCGTVMSNIRSFLTPTAYVRSAGNVMAIADALGDETCPNQQMLGVEGAGTGLLEQNGNPDTAMILRYPQSLFMQWGDAPADFAEGQGGSGFTYDAGKNAAGYNPLFTGSGNSLHRLVSGDGGSTCYQQTSSNNCDNYNVDSNDYAAYGRYHNASSNGIVFYLTGTQIHQHTGELRVLLDSLLATPLGIAPVAVPNEVSRSSPIVASVNGAPAVFQGTFETYSPAIAVPTLSTAADAGAFTFPATKGHLRAIATSSISTSATAFNAIATVFDAATGIPDVSYSGCATPFTSACRTVFTTTAGGLRPPQVILQQSNLTALGTLMAPDLTATEWDTLVQRVLAGTLVFGSYVPKLGGVDRSTVAVIGPSNIAGTDRPTMAYFGATDGMLHAVCASVSGPCDRLGRELWAYIPRKLLPDLRYNTARIDGSPRVVDMFADFYGTGHRDFRTILMFQTGTGDPTSTTRKPAVYALDITDPGAPALLWEYALTNVSSRGTFELGQGLTLAAGQVNIGGAQKNVVFAQTNNGGTGGAASVVTAIDVETGAKLWQIGSTYPAPRVSGHATVPATGIPGGAVGVMKSGNGPLTDLVIATLYGDVYELDPATGANRYGANPLFRFASDYHPFGAPPAIYGSGGQQYAVVVSGGYADPSDTSWSSTVTQYAVSVALNTPTANAPLTDASGPPYVPWVHALGAGQKAFAQALVVGGEVFIATDTADVNSATYGTNATATGHVDRITTSGTSETVVVVQGGAGSVANASTSLFIGSSDSSQQVSGNALSATGTGVDPATTAQVSRKLWLITQ